MATILDVAARAGVGIGTVSRVLNRSPHVRPGTRQKVLEAVAELDYQPNAQARALASGRAGTVAALMPFTADTTAAIRLKGLLDVLVGSELDLVIADIESHEQRLEHLRRLARPDRSAGLVALGPPLDDQEIDAIVGSDVPVVLLGSRSPKAVSIWADRAAAARLATSELLSLGHRSFGYLGSPDQSHDPHALEFRRQLEEVQSHLAWELYLDHEDDAASEDLLEALAGRSATALVCGSDTHAFLALEAARRGGIHVPDELSVIGFGDVDPARFVDLTTVREPLYESGVMAGTALLALLGGDSTEADVELPVRLVRRGSVR